MSAAIDDDDRQLVSKSGISFALGWSRDRLDRRLIADPDFPVERRGAPGARGSSWLFDIKKVRAHLGRDADQAGADVLTRITPRGRRELAQAMRIEDQLQLTRGELVEVGPFRATLAQAFQVWANHDDSASDVIGSRLGLDQDEVATVREILDDRRRELVQELRDFTNEDDDDDDDDDET